MTAEDSLALLLDIGFSRDDWTKFKSVTDEHLKPANMRLFTSNTHIQHTKYNIIDNKVVEEKMELTAEKMTLPICNVGNNYLERWTEDEEAQKNLEKINAAAQGGRRQKNIGGAITKYKHGARWRFTA